MRLVNATNTNKKVLTVIRGHITTVKHPNTDDSTSTTKERKYVFTNESEIKGHKNV